jgi:carboxypeptidase Q
MSLQKYPGTDKLLKNEVVLVGAHIDSWHGGTGAADNASGCIVMMEAMRILKSSGSCAASHNQDRTMGR